MERAMANELYRFVQLRDAVPAEMDDDLLIYAWSDPPSDFESLLIAVANPALIAKAFINDLAPLQAMAALRRLMRQWPALSRTWRSKGYVTAYQDHERKGCCR
jgi:hypothetical protein